MYKNIIQNWITNVKVCVNKIFSSKIISINIISVNNGCRNIVADDEAEDLKVCSDHGDGETFSL